VLTISPVYKYQQRATHREKVYNNNKKSKIKDNSMKIIFIFLYKIILYYKYSVYTVCHRCWIRKVSLCL